MALGNLISVSEYEDFFVGRLNIDLSDTDRVTYMTNIITQLQPDIFKDQLGETLYQDFFNNYTDQKWQDFIDGEVLTINTDEKFEWVGAKAMLAYFIYYYFKKQSESFDSIMGEQFSNTENSASANVELNRKVTEIYNKAIEYYYKGIDYINYKNDETDGTFENLCSKVKYNNNLFGL